MKKKGLRNHILIRLHTKKCFSQGHMLLERLQTGVPGHLKGEIKKTLQQLLKEELVLHYGKTKHGDAYQLNIEKLSEIENEIY